MKGKRRDLVFAMAGFLGVAVTVSGQDAAQPDSMKRAAWQSRPRFQYGATVDPLGMLQQTIAANDALLAKQKDVLGQLAALAEKAEADKAAAHRSTSRGGKK